MDEEWFSKQRELYPNTDYVRKIEQTKIKKREQARLQSRKRWKNPRGRATRTKASKRFTQRVRREVLIRVGGPYPKCAIPTCNWTDPRVLQVDHIKGNGCRETKKQGGSYGLYLRILKMPPTEVQSHFQLLCANHNWIKRFERGEHRKRATGVTSLEDWFM